MLDENVFLKILGIDIKLYFNQFFIMFVGIIEIKIINAQQKLLFNSHTFVSYKCIWSRKSHYQGAHYECC